MKQPVVEEKAYLQIVRREAVRNVLWGILIGGVAVAVIFVFARGWLKWALLLPVIWWLGGCIRTALRDVEDARRVINQRISHDPNDATTS